MLGQGPAVSELREHHRYSTPNWLSGRKDSVFTQEKPLTTPRWYPRSDLCPVQVDLRRAPGWVSEEHLAHVGLLAGGKWVELVDAVDDLIVRGCHEEADEGHVCSGGQRLCR